jgi:hypothetical protein
MASPAGGLAKARLLFLRFIGKHDAPFIFDK